MASEELPVMEEGRSGRVRRPTKESFRCVVVEDEEEARTALAVSPLLFTSPPCFLAAFCSLAGHTSQVLALVAHPYLPLLVSSSLDRTVRVWDVESRSLLRTLEGHSHRVYGLALDPAGRRLASGSNDDTVRLWDLDSGACLHTLGGHSGGIYAMVWEATGSFIASASYDTKVRVWDATAGVLRHTLEGHSDWVYALAAHPTDDLLASASYDSTVRVWRWSSGECLHTLEGHTGWVASLAASAAFIVSGSEDQSVRVWSWTSGECVRVLDGFAGHLDLNSLSWRDSTLVSLDVEADEEVGSMRVWDTSSKDPKEWSCAGSLASSTSCGVAVLSSGRVACLVPGDVRTVAVWVIE